jgi:hypothetical protein
LFSFGDISPETGQGYLISCIAGITGLMFLSLPIPLIVQKFAVNYSNAQAKHIRDKRFLTMASKKTGATKFDRLKKIKQEQEMLRKAALKKMQIFKN